MGKVIAVAQQKGGAGKTMLTVQLAVALGAAAKVAVLDIDPQHSLTLWGRLRAANARASIPLTISTISGWRLAAEMERLAAQHDLVLIDTPPITDSDARRAIRAAQLVLIPLNPAPPDLWAAEGTLKLAAEEKRRAALVFNRASSSRLRKRMEAEIAARSLHLLGSALANRTGYASAFADGLGVVEAAPNSPAAGEVRALAEEVLALLAAPNGADKN